MIQILYQGGHGSHGPRAEALAATTPGSLCGDISNTEPTKIPNLHTIAFWGHGDSYKLCHHSPSELIKLVRKWKKLNRSLKTIEVITCNARHGAGKAEPYVKSLKGKIGILSGTSGMKLKALPVAYGGSSEAWSILLAETTFNSWVYITAPGGTDAMLMEAKTLIDFQKNANGGLSSYRGDVATRANKVVRENRDRKWTMNYGYFNTLRSSLVYV